MGLLTRVVSELRTTFNDAFDSSDQTHQVTHDVRGQNVLKLAKVRGKIRWMIAQPVEITHMKVSNPHGRTPLSRYKVEWQEHDKAQTRVCEEDEGVDLVNELYMNSRAKPGTLHTPHGGALQASELTKDGRSLTFQWIEHDDDQDDRLETHRLNAYVDGVEAGYVRVSLITAAEYRNRYPTIFEYLARDHFRLREATTVDERLVAISLMVDGFGDRLDSSAKRKRLDEMTEQQKTELLASYVPKAHAKFGVEFDMDRWFSADKPYVRYSYVEPSFRGLGVATGMYIESAAIVAVRYGLCLYSGFSRSPAVEPVWASLTKKAAVREEHHPVSGRLRFYIECQPTGERVTESDVVARVPSPAVQANVQVKSAGDGKASSKDRWAAHPIDLEEMEPEDLFAYCHPDYHKYLMSCWGREQCYIILRNGQQVGVAMASYSSGDQWDIPLFSVSPDSVGRGYGEPLLRALMASLAGEIEAPFQVFNCNPYSSALCERVGFERIAANTWQKSLDQ